MKNAIHWLSLATMVISVARIEAADSATYSFANPTVRIGVAAQDGTDEIVLRVSPAQNTPPQIDDSEHPRLAASVKFEPIQDGAADKGEWRYRVMVRGLTPANTIQQHYALVGTDKKPLLYVVTNQPASAFSWNLAKPPDPWVATTPSPFDESGACVTFAVTAKDSVATDITVASSTLVEQTTKVAISVADLRLCGAGVNCNQSEGNPPAPIRLEANTPTPLKLCSVRPLHGNYHGSVVLACLQKPEGDTILQAAMFSTIFAKAIGFILILLGVALAWLIKVYLRGLLNRDQALQPVTVMRIQLRRMQQTLSDLKPDYRLGPVNLNAAVKRLLDELSDSALDQSNLLPPRFPNPIGSAFDPSLLKTYLEKRNPQVQLLAVLIDEGIARAAAEDDGTINPPPAAPVNDAITQIDNIWLKAPQPAPDTALLLVRDILNDLHNKIHKTTIAAFAGVASVRAAQNEFDVLQIQIERISIFMWLVYGLLTALSGFAVLVINNPGFGVALDLIFAFFWGLGLPTAIQSLTPTSAATALNISIAKT